MGSLTTLLVEKIFLISDLNFLVHLEAISSHLIPCYSKKDTDPYLTVASFQVIAESNKVSPWAFQDCPSQKELLYFSVVSSQSYELSHHVSMMQWSCDPMTAHTSAYLVCSPCSVLECEDLPGRHPSMPISCATVRAFPTRLLLYLVPYMPLGKGIPLTSVVWVALVCPLTSTLALPALAPTSLPICWNLFGEESICLHRF